MGECPRQSECPVCLDDCKGRIWCVFPCLHSVCMHCTTQMRSPLCPLCRYDLSDALPPRRTQVRFTLASEHDELEFYAMVHARHARMTSLLRQNRINARDEGDTEVNDERDEGDTEVNVDERDEGDTEFNFDENDNVDENDVAYVNEGTSIFTLE